MRSLCQPVWVKSVIRSLTYSLWEHSTKDEVIRKVQESHAFGGGKRNNILKIYQ